MSIRLSPSERASLERAAQVAGFVRRRVVTASEYAREAIAAASKVTLEEHDNKPML